MNGGMIIPLLAVKPAFIVMIVVIVLLIAGIVALGIYGRKLQRQQEESQKQLEAAAQTMSILIIDKKRMKFKEAGFPSIVMDQVPKTMRGRKVPVVKAKIGPRIMSLMCEEKLFDQIPIKKKVKASISGIYILDIKGMKLQVPEKKGLFSKLRKKANDAQNSIDTGKKKEISPSEVTGAKKKKK